MVSVIIVSVFWFLLWPYARYQRVMCGCRVTMPTIPLTPGIMAPFPTPSFRAKSFTEYAHHLSVHSSPFWECYLQNEFKTIAEEHPMRTSLLFVVEFVICCTVPTAFWWSIRVLHFVVVGQADMATRRLGTCAESAAVMDHFCIEILV
jgi:hypothetical protein